MLLLKNYDDDIGEHDMFTDIIMICLAIIIIITIMIHSGDYGGSREKGGLGGQWTMHLHILHHHLTLPPTPTVQFNSVQNSTL